MRRRIATWFFVLIATGAALACGDDGATPPTPAPTPAASSSLTMVNETPCVLHFRFDNGVPRGRIQPMATVTYDDPSVASARFVKFESTRAIFRTYPMEQIRADGDRIVVKPAADDGPCAEEPAPP